MKLRDEFNGVAAFCITCTLAIGGAFGAPAEASLPKNQSPPSTKPPLTKPVKKFRKVEINADSYSYGNDAFVAKGSVEVIDGDMRLAADEVVVKMRKANTGKTGTDKTSTNPYESIKAIGTTRRVTLKTAQGQAEADRIEYDLTRGSGLAVLAGKPEVTFVDGGRLFGANSIILDRTKQVLWTMGGKPKAIIPNDGPRDGVKPKAMQPPATSVKPVVSVPQENAPVPTPKSAKKAVVKTTTETTTVPRAPTEVEADKLAYDMKANIIRCIGGVHVIDEEFDLKADTLDVFRNDTGATTRIVATGQELPVRLETVMKDYKRGVATGPKLVYDVPKQTMVLSGKATLKTERGHFSDVDRVNFKKTKSGFNVDVEGGTFTLWTDSDFLDFKGLNDKKNIKKETRAPKVKDK